MERQAVLHQESHPKARNTNPTAHHNFNGGGLEKQQVIPDSLTLRLQLAERFNLLRNLHPAVGDSDKLRLPSHGCGGLLSNGSGAADSARSGSRPVTASRTLDVATRFPRLGRSPMTWLVAGLRSLSFPSLFPR